MIQNLGPFPGHWCDVDWSPADGGFVFAYQEPHGVLRVARVRFNDAVLGDEPSRWFDLGRTGLYLRAAADGHGNVCCVLQDGRDRNPATGQFYPAIVVLFPKDGPPREIACPAGPAFGQNAVEVIGFYDDFTVFVAMSPTTNWSARLAAGGEWSHAVLGQWPATSQGFADFGTRYDDVRASVPGMVCPSTADGLSIGQAGEPDRIRGLHNGVYFTAIPGPGFEPHLASDGQGRWMACARTPQGAALVALAAPFEPETAPEPEPEPIPDTPFVVDPHGVVEDVAAWLFSPNQGQDIHFSADGTVRMFVKSDELSGDGPEPQIAEWWDVSGGYIGHLEDASMGRRIYQGKPVSAETIVRLFPNDHAAVWASLPLYRNWWKDGARVWLPRRCVSGYRLKYTTDFSFNTGEVHPNVLIEIRVDVGHGVMHGREVRVRGAYISSPDNGRTWNAEVNYYGVPNGHNAWIAGPFAAPPEGW